MGGASRMSTHEKALKRLASAPKDFTWNELVSLMLGLSFDLEMRGGSGRKFVHTKTRATLFIHEPHPGNTLHPYQVRDAIDLLKREGYL